MAKITVGGILSSIFAILFILNGIILMPSSPFGGSIILLIGIFLIPNIRQKISEEYDLEFSTGVVVLIAIIGLGIFGAVSPSSTNDTNTQTEPEAPDTGNSPQQTDTDTENQEQTEPDTDTGNQEQTQTERKTKSSNLTIDRIETQAGNLYPTRVTVRNTGDVAVSPRFDMYVYDDQGTEVCTGSPMLNPYSTLTPGNEETEELRIGTCMMEEDGTYTLQVDLLDDDFNKLDTKREDFTISYWGSFS